MAGGLMNLISQGQQNVVLFSNPSKSFFKCAYKKITNFGKQNFRLDYEGTPTLHPTHESTFTFKVKRYADLLMDCYICVTLPTIWSPMLPPQPDARAPGGYTNWAPYEFQWVQHLGAQIVRRVTVHCGNQQLQQFSGQYLLAAAQRDMSAEKRALFETMIGHVPELVDPGNAGARVNAYPNAFFTESPAGAQPSIDARQLWIPLGAWFTLLPSQAFPLVALQNNELTITVSFRPVNEWFTIRDVMDPVNNFPTVAPNFNQPHMQMYRFLQTPPSESLDAASYVDQRTNWFADIHLNCTYCFLSNDEVEVFSRNEQVYLVKQVHERTFFNVTGANKVDLESSGLVTSWMLYFQRSDANLRNQWSNYSNWPYAYMPRDLSPGEAGGSAAVVLADGTQLRLGPGANPDLSSTGLYTTGAYSPENIKDILVAMGVLLDGQYRENMLPAGVFNYAEKFARSAGFAPSGIYCYNFCLNTDPHQTQPSGAMNMSRFGSVQLEFVTITPPANPYAQVLTVCDPATGDIVGINKPTWRIYDYNFNMVLFEERINVVTFVGGNAGLMYAT